MHLICFTLLADSNELMSMPSSSLFISKVTGRRTPFSRTSRLRLSRGVWRDDILSLDRANWRNRREKQHRRDEMSVLTRKSDNEYDLCQTNATRINKNIKNSAHWPISGIKIAFYKHEWNMSYKWSQCCWQVDRPLCSANICLELFLLAWICDCIKLSI